jgi:hypothetical protein
MSEREGGFMPKFTNDVEYWKQQYMMMANYNTEMTKRFNRFSVVMMIAWGVVLGFQIVRVFL